MARPTHKTRGFFGNGLSRRRMLRLSAVGALAGSVSGWLEALAAEAIASNKRHRACILLWMSGGPSQMDTFDLKPDSHNGGLFREIATSVPGIRISEHLPKLAEQIDQMAIIRSMSTKEGDHGRATQMAHTGYSPQGPIRYPTLGSLVAKELGADDAALPNFVSIAPYRVFSPGAYLPGFLGSEYAPLLVGDTQVSGDDEDEYALNVEDLKPSSGLSDAAVRSRLGLLKKMNSRFISRHNGPPALSYQTAYDRAIRLMRSEAGSAFDLEDEPDTVRDAYGRNRFGQGCLLARRLVERGVPFVEVTLSGTSNQSLGWDTHTDNFTDVRRLSNVLDPAWATLMTELKSRGLLESTLIVWMGEFGRTPKINPNGGRDHYPQAWTTVLAGGGVRGGQVVGRTSNDGTTVEERPVSIPDLLATVYRAIKIDPTNQNDSNVGRPIRIVDPAAKPIGEILA